jgi:hypothetical protein
VSTGSSFCKPGNKSRSLSAVILLIKKVFSRFSLT